MPELKGHPMNPVRSTLLILAAALLWGTGSSRAQSCAQTPSGIVSWWPAESSTEDIVGANHGTLQDNASYGQGIVGMAFELDGSSDHVLVPDDPSLNLQEFSFEAWVRSSAASNLFVVSKSGTTGNFGYELGMNPAALPRITINGGLAGADILGTSDIVDGQFHHLVATFENPWTKLYVDGVLVGRSTVPANVDYEADSDLYIGARELPGIPGFWPGQIDELTIYSRALCYIEIETLYEAASAGKCEGGVVVECPIFTDDLELGDTGEWSRTIP